MPSDPKLTHVAVQWKYSRPFIACRFDPTGRYVFASAEDNSIQRWEIDGGAQTALKAHDSWVRGFVFSADGGAVVSGGSDGRLIWWSAADAEPQPIRTIDAHAGWIRSMSSNPERTRFVTGGNDRLVKLWNTADGTLIREFPGHESHVYSVLYHPGGEWILSGDLKGQVHQWEAATGKLVRSFDAAKLWSYNSGQGVDFGGVRTLAVSPDGKHLACGGLYKASNPLGAVHEPLVLLFEWESQKLVQQHVAEGLKGVVWRAQWHPDGYLIGVSGGSSGGFLLFWKPDGNKEFFRFKLPNLARDGDLHRDGVQVVTTHYDRHVRISRLEAKG